MQNTVVKVEIINVAGYAHSISTSNPREAALWLLRMVLHEPALTIENFSGWGPIRIRFWPEVTTPHEGFKRLIEQWEEGLQINIPDAVFESSNLGEMVSERWGNTSGER